MDTYVGMYNLVLNLNGMFLEHLLNQEMEFQKNLFYPENEGPFMYELTLLSQY